MVTEEYISGFLEAISRVKDIITPNVGGTNTFFSIPKDYQKSLLENIQNFITANKTYYVRFENEEQFSEKLKKIQLVEINKWKENFGSLISTWTCDTELSEINGKNGYFLSEYLVKYLLPELFKDGEVKLFKMLPDWEYWHWGDQMSEEYIFETDLNIFIMHFGEST